MDHYRWHLTSRIGWIGKIQSSGVPFWFCHDNCWHMMVISTNASSRLTRYSICKGKSTKVKPISRAAPRLRKSSKMLIYLTVWGQTSQSKTKNNEEIGRIWPSKFDNQPNLNVKIFITFHGGNIPCVQNSTDRISTNAPLYIWEIIQRSIQAMCLYITNRTIPPISLWICTTRNIPSAPITIVIMLNTAKFIL